MGSLRLPGLSDPTALAFDPVSERLSAVRGGELLRAPISDLSQVRRSNVDQLGLKDLRGATFDPAGAWWLLDAGARAVVTLEPAVGLSAGPSNSIGLRDVPAGRLRGLAFNPADGLLYVANVDRQVLYGVDASGDVRATHDLEGVDIRKLSGMVFAPSADPTDDPGTMHLYVADAGDRSALGRVAEVTLAAEVTVAAPIDTATLVQTIDTSKFSPASPDPAGVTYRPSRDRLLIADSEVDETTGAGYHGVNLWEITRSGTVTDTGTTVPFTNEPTGLGFDAGTETLFVSTDVGNKIWVDRPGTDGRFGTSDDVRTSIDTRAYGLTDTEDPEFDPSTGHLFFVDGVSVEVYELDPVNGIFGDGNDVLSHFDVGKYGASDTEALASDPVRNTLLVGDRPSRKIYEVTKDGALVRIIDASGIPGMKRISGMAMAPASTDRSVLHYWIVDRAVDNGSNASENDGKLFEITVPASGNTPPAVDAGLDQTITMPDPVTLQGIVTDDGLPDPPGTTTSQWSRVSGPGTVTFADPAAPGTTATFSTDGTYVLRLTANDSAAQSSDETTVTVLPAGTSGPGVIEVSVARGSDDAEESATGGVGLGSSDLELVLDGSNQIVGLRFTGVAIPAGATVVSAYVQFRVDEVGSAATSLTVRGQASDAPGTFTTATGNVSSRPRTTASVGWTPAPWATVGQVGLDQRTPNLAAVIQEIVSRPGWTSGKALALIITGTGKRTADSYNGGWGPILHVEYQGA